MPDFFETVNISCSYYTYSWHNCLYIELIAQMKIIYKAAKETNVIVNIYPLCLLNVIDNMFVKSWILNTINLLAL